MNNQARQKFPQLCTAPSHFAPKNQNQNQIYNLNINVYGNYNNNLYDNYVYLEEGVGSNTICSRQCNCSQSMQQSLEQSHFFNQDLCQLGFYNQNYQQLYQMNCGEEGIGPDTLSMRQFFAYMDWKLAQACC
eukprot:TRINITY_DN581_c0_g1_i2.p3 TRINITY_DN581_c0_g1~~TRINITY_DN581_c0_g1_i2.p3  ORF type:complete len:149 (-),score=10.60 TRINITY_DN581_c0_g1_i2:384-779(-)